MDRLSYA